MKPVKRKVIISCAVTGRMHTPSMSENLPCSPEQITQQSIDAARAGASILHLHARNPSDGSPTSDPAIFDLVLPRLAEGTDAIIVTPASPGPVSGPPDLRSIQMGSTNHTFSKAARGISDWNFAWEKPYLEASEDGVLRNSFRDMKSALAGSAARPGCWLFECHDLGHLYNLAQLVGEGLVNAPLFIEFSLGIAGGLNSDPENLFLMRSTADRLFGRQNYEFSVMAAGRHQISLVTMAAIMGGHARVGLGDSLYLGKGLLATSNAAQVLKIRRILEDLSLEIATPDETRAILQIEGPAASAYKEAGSNG
ncbi:MAG: 3-keto-5-aminohexanoate cleavage protein [Rhizobiales bacterium]|nr:3-keto-5-aminohexanoate cleavage protein [Hyphomicrobiales bacterium]MBA70839.1 3-keto-5-aminohexanoate cleavage protein [Hyphomicrobiales bacterium]|tara:strand:- start:2667 stop:3593 length:927 start_codon:yes stop_codon:yes gene_type:complete